MAAAAHTVPGLELSTVDDMDLHSDDGGLDFNDGDIELDLDPPPSHSQDDEMSMNDAASANGVDAETVPGEQDDFMVDQEDVIEEGYSYQEDDGVIVVDHPAPVASQSVPVNSPPAPFNLLPIQTNTSNQDDDLIDYSEEGEDYHNPELRSPWLRKESYHSEAQEAQDEQAKDIDEEQDEIPADLQALLSMPTNNKSPTPHVEAQSAADHSAHGLAADERAHSPLPQSVDDNEEDGRNDDGDGDGDGDGGGGVMLPGQEEYADGETQKHGSEHQGYDQEASTEGSEHQDPESFEFPSVTVNYQGEELWLFKQHDYDNSGEWLIQDVSLAKASLSDLFQACRHSLGEDVSGETEIGFKFEHLQNLDIFEDNTACVAVSLERLIGYYQALHAQDGNNEPDSFYISLMFRPRFATLLSDIAKYADQGSGYSAFEAAVVAGETHFAGIIGGASSDELTEWDTQEQEQEYDEQKVEQGDPEAPEFTNGETQRQEHVGEGDQSEGEDKQETHDDEGVEVHEDKHTSAEHSSNRELEHSEENCEQITQGEDSAKDPEEEDVEVEHSSHEEQEPTAEEDQSLQTANPSDISANPQEVVNQPHHESLKLSEETDAELEARRLQELEDFVDYSDEDEPPAHVKEPKEAPAAEPSPSSVTLQGDEPANADEHASVAGSTSHSGKASQDDEEAKEEPHIEVGHDETEGNDENNQSYQDYVQVFDEDDPFQNFHADGTNDYAADAYDCDANQDFANHEYQDFDGQPELDFMNGDEFNTAGAETTDGNDVNGADEFLDLENNPEWDADQELAQEDSDKTTNAHDIFYAQDEEDGVAGQTANATSSAADPTTASFSDAQEVSPQGQKRSIDEAGHGEDIAPDSIDAKRARV